MTEDLANFEKVSPGSLRSFLRASGWTFEPGVTWNDSSELWSLGDREILVPLRPSYRDYATLVRQACLAISGAVDRSEYAVLRELVDIAFDTLRFRVGTDNGLYSIGLDEGRLLLGEIRHLMFSAASATVQPRRTLPRRNSVAESYMRELRLPVPEPGSFVLAVQSPIPTPDDIYQQEQVLDKEETSVASKGHKLKRLVGRDVVRTLVTAIDAAEHAASEALRSGELTPFDVSVAAGVSATLCRSMASLEKLPGHFVEVAVDLSPAVEVETEREYLVRPRRLHGDRKEIYESAAEFLSQPGVTKEVEIVGYVTEIRRPTGSMFGTAVINATYGANQRNLRVLMLAEDFSKAARALDQSLPLKCVGLVREESNGRLVMDRPSEVAAQES